MTELLQSPWFNLVSLIVGLFVGGVGIFVTFRLTKTKKPMFVIKSNNLVENLTSKLKTQRLPLMGMKLKT